LGRLSKVSQSGLLESGWMTLSLALTAHICMDKNDLVHKFDFIFNSLRWSPLLVYTIDNGGLVHVLPSIHGTFRCNCYLSLLPVIFSPFPLYWLSWYLGVILGNAASMLVLKKNRLTASENQVAVLWVDHEFYFKGSRGKKGRRWQWQLEFYRRRLRWHQGLLLSCVIYFLLISIIKAYFLAILRPAIWKAFERKGTVIFRFPAPVQCRYNQPENSPAPSQ